LQIITEVEQIEEQQIQYQIAKHNPKKQKSKTIQKIFCHSCMEQIEIISKEFFFTFPDGMSVFFCNEQEKKLWVGIYKLNG